MTTSLKGQFLVAMPDMADQRFAKSVVYMVGHSEDGAMGIMVNQNLPDMRFADVLEEMNLGDPDALINLPSAVKERDVLRGGPVDKGRGFVLHSTDYFREDNSYAVTDEVCLTATIDVLHAISFGPGPEKSLLALGYCGWNPGQLEDELKNNGWLTTEYSSTLLFDTPVEKRYEMALSSLGATLATLSSQAGHA